MNDALNTLTEAKAKYDAEVARLADKMRAEGWSTEDFLRATADAWERIMEPVLG
jgi:hypothetical protein